MAASSLATPQAHALKWVGKSASRVRGFTTTAPVYAKARQVSLNVKNPEFNWRNPKGMLVGGGRPPLVQYTRSVEEANELLETVRASRVSLHQQMRTVEKIEADRTTTYKSVEVGVLCVGDGQGVIVLHLSHMKRVPKALLRLLENPDVTKATFGAETLIWDYHKYSDKWVDVQCANMLDLRALSPLLVPRLKEPSKSSSMSHAEYRRLTCLEMLKLDHKILGNSQEWHVEKLSGTLLDYLVNSTWLSVQICAALDENLDKLEAALSAGSSAAKAQEIVDAVLARCTWTTEEYLSMLKHHESK